MFPRPLAGPPHPGLLPADFQHPPPAFWLALLLLMVFSVWLGWLPVGLSVPIGVEAGSITLADRLYHAILPALTLSITGVANIALHTREKMIDVMESEYVLFARARGESRRSIVLRHGLRNVALPAITLQFASISEIIGGSVLVEEVFSYPGLGQVAVDAGLGSDLPLLLGITVVTAAIVFAGNLIARPALWRGGPEDPKGGGAVMKAWNSRKKGASPFLHRRCAPVRGGGGGDTPGGPGDADRLLAEKPGALPAISLRDGLDGPGHAGPDVDPACP